MASLIVFIGVVLYVISPVKACCISITTLKQSGAENDFTFTRLTTHGYQLKKNATSINFEVKACRNAYLGLMQSNNGKTALYTVAIGEEDNTRTVLYENKLEPYLHEVEHGGALLDCDRFKAFSVKWADDKIELWSIGTSSTEIFSHSNVDTSNIKFIGVSTHIYAVGNWNILDPDSAINDEISSPLCAKSTTTSQTSMDTTSTTTAEKTLSTTETLPTNIVQTKSSTMKTPLTTTFQITSLPTKMPRTTTAQTTLSTMKTPLTTTAQETSLTTKIPRTTMAQTASTNMVMTPTIAEKTSTTMETPRAISADMALSTMETTMTNSSEMCPETGITNMSDAMTCTRVCQMDTITIEQLMEEIKKLKEELTVNKESLSKQMNSLISADDKRPSAAVVGYVGVVIIASLFIGILLIDLPNLVRMFRLMHRNLTS